MTVLERGKKPTGFITRLTCSRCSSKVEIDLVNDDLEWKNQSTYVGNVSEDGYKFWTGSFDCICPVCDSKEYAYPGKRRGYTVIPIFGDKEESQ